MYSEGLHRDQRGLAVTIVSPGSNLVDPHEVLLSILRPRAKRAHFEHADWYQSARSTRAQTGPKSLLRVHLAPPAKRRPFEHAEWYQSACSKWALLALGESVLKVDFLAPFGPASNVPIGTNQHVQRGPFWRRAQLYSEGHHCVQHGLHYNIFVGTAQP